DVVMEAKATKTADGRITQDSAALTDGHFWGTFTFQENFDQVRITNESPGDLILDTIDLVHAVAQPHVQLDTSPPTDESTVAAPGGPDAAKSTSVDMQLNLERTVVTAVHGIQNI